MIRAPALMISRLLRYPEAETYRAKTAATWYQIPSNNAVER
jgi:hypothetical protein